MSRNDSSFSNTWLSKVRKPRTPARVRWQSGAHAWPCSAGGVGMSVYAIAQLSFKDRRAYARYQARFMDVLRKSRGGRLLVADEAPLQLEGRWDRDKLVIISFPDEV